MTTTSTFSSDKPVITTAQESQDVREGIPATIPQEDPYEEDLYEDLYEDSFAYEKFLHKAKAGNARSPDRMTSHRHGRCSISDSREH